MTAPENFTPQEKPIIIPAEILSDEALLGIIDDFILREGTDYGAHEVSHETKQNQVRKLIDREDALILFEATTQSVTLVLKKEYRRKP